MNRTRHPAPNPALRALHRRLRETCTRDRGRLGSRLRKLERARDNDGNRIEALREDIAASVARRRARAAAKPPLALDASLPISAHAEDIIALIRRHPAVVVAGATGSGKTTQLPKLCLAAGRGEAGLIGCTQPRRLAARSVARRVAEELGTTVGAKVGFQVRFSEQVGDATLVKFMTDGILLAETQSDPWLSAYDTLIIDEAHERSLNIDFLLGYLKRLLTRRRDLKVIITSATIDTARFAAHFDGAPVVEVEGRAFPVEVRWRPVDAGDTDAVVQGGPEHIVRAIDEISTEDPRGDVLVFLPGEREIRDAHRVLARRQFRHTEILPLYARLSARDQDRVFKPGPLRRIVLATNVAETSLTVPRIRYVVDTGTARVMRYSRRSQIERLHVEPVSQAAADQRQGRCGRLGPGICVRLYGEDDYARRPRFTEPELLRSSLANVILRMLGLKLGAVEDFPFLDAPDAGAVADGYRRLVELSAIDDARRLTPLGHELARLPIDVQLARMLVEARRLDVLREALVVVAFLSVQDPRERPAAARGEADAAHREFANASSDFVGMLNLWHAYAAAREECSRAQLREWCTRHFLVPSRMREWRDVHRQLLLAMKPQPTDTAPSSPSSRARTPAPSTNRATATGRARPASRIPSPDTANPATRDSDPDPATCEALHCSLLSGLPTQVARKDDYGMFRGPRGRKFAVFPGSALAKAPPAWVFAAQILDTGGKVWAMQCARIEPRWIERQAAHLLRRTCRDAHWSRERGAVMAYEQVSLFGLVLVERRAVTYRRQDPALAHAIFVREALARCDIDARAAFVHANARVLAEARDIEARRRRQDLVQSDSDLARFIDGKLPQHVADSRVLDAWYRKATPATQAALHWSLDDVLAGTGGLSAGAFPSALEFAGQRYRLSYRFEPGDPADGVTLHLPLALLDALPAARCQWLVPGLLPDKVAAMIRSLPKALRRNFVPAPDFARAFTEAVPPEDAPLASVLARFLARITGVALAAETFATERLEPHFHMRFVLEDERGRSLAASRDLEAMRVQWKAQARVAFARRTDFALDGRDASTWDFGDLPESVVAPGRPIAFPALVDQGSSVALRSFARREEARTEHVRGVERLLRLALAGPFKRVRKQLPVSRALALHYAPIGTVDDLREDLLQGGFADLLQTHDLDARTQTSYAALLESVRHGLSGAAVARLQLAEAILAARAQAQPWLQPARPGQAPASYADMAEQLECLLFPHFLREVPLARLAHYPRYLEALQRRGERLQRDPGKDQRRLRQVLPYWHAWRERHAAGEASPALDRLRWLIEEWRVSLFAQELKTAEPVSTKRLQQALDAL